jgi:3-hydroxymyristoyl/3-hydroxydecanoyl-(acyl carrier protein) dehydratase
VLQLDWVFEIIAKWLGCYPSLTRIEQLKFKRPMGPGREFTMKLERDVQGERFRFHLAEGPDIFCVGCVALEATPRADR